MSKNSSTDYVKYLTERVVDYIETPRDTRKITKEKAKAEKEQWLIRWFGVGGAFIYYWRNKKN